MIQSVKFGSNRSEKSCSESRDDLVKPRTAPSHCCPYLLGVIHGWLVARQRGYVVSPLNDLDLTLGANYHKTTGGSRSRDVCVGPE